MILIFPAALGVALDVRIDPDVFSRDPGFFTRSVQQNSGSEHSVQQSCFTCTHVSHLPKNGCGVLQW